MRKVTKEIIKAWSRGESKTISDTRTDGTSIYLHNNRIVTLSEDDEIIFSLAGYNTPTTRERINGVLDYLSKSRIYCKNFAAMRNNTEISTIAWHKA